MQVYYPGQSVSGSLQLVLKEPKWYQYAAVSLTGKGKVSWTESHTVRRGNYRVQQTERYSDKKTYADMFIVIWGDKNASQPVKVDSGTSNFSFQFTIPAHCPPTFNSIIGKIGYQLFGIIASQVKEYKVETPLIIRPLVDLNSQPHLLQPFNETKTKNIMKCCCCCDTGEAEVTFKMPRTGFCLKQDQIPIVIECMNGSSEEISLDVEVSQITTYKANGHTRIEVNNANIFFCNIPASTLTSDTKSANPDIPKSIILGFKSKMIEISHFIVLSVSRASLCSWPSDIIEIPVVIGNVPFRNDEANTAQPPTVAAGSGDEPTNASESPQTPLSIDILPQAD